MPKFTVSKETTLLTEPLRPDGRVDYLKVMNDRLSRGVTPENNAAVELVQAVGPGFLPEATRKEVLARLDLPDLPVSGDYLTDICTFHKMDVPQNDAEGNDIADWWHHPFFARVEFTESHPWSKDEYPESAAWIDANERNFHVLMAGSRKDRLFAPLMDEQGNFWRAALSFHMIENRNVLRLFRARAMNELHSGRLEEAWQIILASYRWAWLTSQGPLELEYIAAVGMEGIAADVLRRLISSQRLTARQATGFIADLDRLPSWPSVKEFVFYGERYYYLDHFQDLATDGCQMPPETITLPGGEQQPNPSLAHGTALKRLVDDPRLDWNEAFRYRNEREKPFLDAWNCPNVLERFERLGRAEKEIPRHFNNLETILKDDFPSMATPTELAQRLVELTDSWGFHLLMARMECERAVRFELCRLALALAGYRSDRGKYPSILTELCAKYLAAVPGDPFSGGEPIYKPEKDGYLLYSVGPNGIDDGGRNFMRDDKTPEEFERATEEEKAADDIAIRMPTKT